MTSLNALVMFGRASAFYASIGTVIATHLLVERAIERVLEDAKASTKSTRFDDKLTAARRLKPKTKGDWYWRAAKLLNRARNQVAHVFVENDQMFPPDAARYAEQFVGLVHANLDVDKWVGPAYHSKARFERTAFAYYAFMSDYAKLHVGAKPIALSGFTAFGEEEKPDAWQALFGE